MGRKRKELSVELKFLGRVIEPSLDSYEHPFIRKERDELLMLAIEQALETITPREKQILSFRYGLDGDGEKKTLEKCGEKFFVTGERVRQIEAKALRKLSHPARKLQKFLPFLKEDK